jgi:dTDP-4-amino-4,6-dideoxygalactose transaminase
VIPYGRQHVDDDDIAAVVAVLRGDWLTQGPHIELFEQRLALTVDARHAIAFSSGTAALHAATLAAGLRPGDRVATSTLTFSASAACALYVGATPTLVDIDPRTLNLDANRLPPCEALVAVHFAGLPMDLSSLPHRPQVVIEDAAHALGATTPDGPVGNCARSDMCMFSFHPVKAVTTGEGGAITTNDDDLAARLRHVRHHGIRHTPERGAWFYDVETLGHNFRLTDIQAALGSSQLKKLRKFVSRRQDIANRYRVGLDGSGVILPPGPPTDTTHAYHLFPVQVPERARIFDGMRAAGIGVQVHYVPLHRHSLYAPFAVADDYPFAEAAFAGLLSLPLFPDLTDDDVDRVVNTLLALL